MTEEPNRTDPFPSPPSYTHPVAVSGGEDRLGFRRSNDEPGVSPAPNPFSQIISQKPVIIDDSAVNGFDIVPDDSGNRSGNNCVTSEGANIDSGPETLRLSSLVTIETGGGDVGTEVVDFNRATPGETVKKGMLWKRSRARKFFAKIVGIKNWKERMFILTSSRELWVRTCTIISSLLTIS